MVSIVGETRKAAPYGLGRRGRKIGTRLGCRGAGQTGAWTALAVSSLALIAAAGDWPMYRHDMARSGVTDEQIRLPLSLSWERLPAHKPRPAWGLPNPRPVGGWFRLHEGPRTRFDDAYQTAVAGGRVFYGSSATGKVMAVDLATGRRLWSFWTAGPVRLGPTVWRDRVYVGSDDGRAYCLRAKDGTEVWQFDAGLGKRMLLGNGAMISLWPVRTGIVVDQGVAWFGAGVFPSEGAALYAVRADTGKLVWRNDVMTDNRFSPQGYLLLSKQRLYVPQGRVPPAVFDRRTGRLISEDYINHHVGGTFALLSGERLFTGTNEIVGFAKGKPRDRVAWFWGRRLVIRRRRAWIAGNGEIKALDYVRYGKASLGQAALQDQLWRARSALHSAKRRKDRNAIAAAQKNLDTLLSRKSKLEKEMAACIVWRTRENLDDALILAGNTLFAGGKGRVAAFSAADGRRLWSATVPGTVKGLAAADGRLLVSSDTGAILCFAASASGNGRQAGRVLRPEVVKNPYPEDGLSGVYAAAAKTILKLSKVARGYALVLGAGRGRLAFELARRSHLFVIGVEADAEKVRLARERLDRAGLYGTRVVIHHFSPNALPFSDYFADLIVSDSLLRDGLPGGDGFPRPAAIARFLKPCGGVAILGAPATAPALRARRVDRAALKAWLAGLGVGTAAGADAPGVWAMVRRGALPGAGAWTHGYADPGNTTCGNDALVRAPLGLLWFGAPGPARMVDRHRRVVPPVAGDGRFFVEGYQCVMAYDAYNGVKLWERDIPGVTRTGASVRPSNMILGKPGLFLAVRDRALCLAPDTGKTLREYTPPKRPNGRDGYWGWIAFDHGLLYGSREVDSRNAGSLFALDPATGKAVWNRDAGRAPETAIALDGDTLFYVDTAVSAQERSEALKARAAKAAALQGPARSRAEDALKRATVYAVVALDARTGKRRWRRPVDLTGCTGFAHYLGLNAIAARGVLVIFGVYTDGHYWNEFYAGQFDSRRVVALAQRDGRTLWSKKIGYRVRPLVVGDTLHAEPWAFDLHTGVQKRRRNPITGALVPWEYDRPGHHCGCPAAARHMLLFRSWSLAWYDLDSDYGTVNFGGQRSGCWINFIPANGLLIVPEASSGCLCAFPVQTTVVFEPMPSRGRRFGVFASPGEALPVRELAVNLAGPGDRRARDGKLWLAFPRPGGHLVLRFSLKPSFYPGGRWFKRRPEDLSVAGSDAPWLFASGMAGVRRIVIPVRRREDGRALYRLRLGFAEIDGARPGDRVFDVAVNGKTVLSGFDPVRAAGGANRAVFRSIDGIKVTGKNVTVEFVSRFGKKPSAGHWPVLQCLDLVRTKVLAPGIAVESYLLSDAQPRQVQPVTITNEMAEAFSGRLRVSAPAGFAAEPSSCDIRLAPGQRRSVRLALRATVPGRPRRVSVKCTLVSRDGRIKVRRSAEVEYLGPWRRIATPAVEDAFVLAGAPHKNFARTPALNVDGGGAAMGDSEYAQAYLRFRFPRINGKTARVLLRLRVSDNPGADSWNSGRVCLVDGPWAENTLTYANRPKTGREVAKLGRIHPDETVERPLALSLDGKDSLDLTLEPQSTDGTSYCSRESAAPPTLVIDYLPAKGR